MRHNKSDIGDLKAALRKERHLDLSEVRAGMLRIVWTMFVVGLLLMGVTAEGFDWFYFTP